MKSNNSRIQISKLAKSGKLSHAYIIIGGPESDKYELAEYLAEVLLCSNTAESESLPCGTCNHCRKAAKKIHPDIIVIERLPDKKELLVDQIREMIKEAYVLPNEANRKVFIINEAELLNSNAQNAMLKLLEEPPYYACFILIVNNPGSLYDTVRSRCIELYASVKASKQEHSELAEKIAKAIVDKDSLSLADYCNRAEKLDKNAFDLLLDELYSISINTAKSSAAYDSKSRSIRLAELIETLREMRSVNVGTGHCVGLLLSQLA